jgi:hypothetical protein
MTKHQASRTKQIQNANGAMFQTGGDQRFDHSLIRASDLFAF